MANLKSSVRTNNRRKEKGMKKTILTKDLNVEEEQWNNVRDFRLRILHHNVQSLSNKKNEITMTLTVDGRHFNILCLTEHSLREDQLNIINIDQYKLVSKYCRISSTLGGSCIYVNNTIQCKEVPWFDNLGSDKVFELSVVELLEHHTILACIYRSPDHDIYEFLNKLEALVVKASSKVKCVILCGDWNVNFLHQNGKLQDLQNLLWMNKLINVIKVPMRITSLSKSLIDVVIVYNNKKKSLVEVLDMGYSDHLAQYVCIKVKEVQEEPIMIYKRQFTNTNMDHFRHVIYEEKWKEVIKVNEPNISFMLFMNIFMLYFNVAFPVDKVKVNYMVQRWITKGLIVSRNKLCILQKIKRMQCPSAECLEYIHLYQQIFRKVLNEAKRKESDRYVLAAKNKSKAL